MESPGPMTIPIGHFIEVKKELENENENLKLENQKLKAELEMKKHENYAVNIRKIKLEEEKKRLKEKITILNDQIFIKEHKSVLLNTMFNDLTGSFQDVLYNMDGPKSEEFKKAIDSLLKKDEIIKQQTANPKPCKEEEEPPKKQIKKEYVEPINDNFYPTKPNVSSPPPIPILKKDKRNAEFKELIKSQSNLLSKLEHKINQITHNSHIQEKKIGDLEMENTLLKGKLVLADQDFSFTQNKSAIKKYLKLLPKDQKPDIQENQILSIKISEK